MKKFGGCKTAEVRVAEKPEPVAEKQKQWKKQLPEESGRLHNVTKQQIITLFNTVIQ